MPSWNETKRKKKTMPMMQLKAELILWNLIANSANQLNVVFFDPFETELVREVEMMRQDVIW